jgi:uncharacterized repeat protein (TIGR01451 family)
MSVSPSGCIADTVTQLQYTINFMNTGNDTAFDIYVMDTLPNNVDPNSLRVVMASNTMNIAMLYDGVNNIVKFDFPAIDLLDSAACPQCSGAIIFSINTLPGLPTGTSIFNHAGIFFDDNPVVMTDTVENIMGGCTTTSVKNIKSGSSITIYPNPAHDLLYINIPDNTSLSFGEGRGEVTITNLLGQTLYSQQPTTNSQLLTIDISDLPNGVYIVKINDEVRKFVKE